MKKILAVVLCLILCFSFTNIAYAHTTLESYLDTFESEEVDILFPEDTGKNFIVVNSHESDNFSIMFDIKDEIAYTTDCLNIRKTPSIAYDRYNKVPKNSGLHVVGLRNIAGTIDTITAWEIDRKMPIIKDEYRKYVERFIYVGEGM